jgi:hypothetical protein
VLALREEQRDREDWEGSWLLCCVSGRRKGIAGLLLGIWRKERRIAAALLGIQLLLLVLEGIAGDGRQQAASPCDGRSEQQVCCFLID